MATTYTGGSNGVDGSIADATVFGSADWSSNVSIDSLVAGMGRKWGGAIGAGVTVTFSFNLGNGQSDYHANYLDGSVAGRPDDEVFASGMNAGQQEAARSALASWAAVANIVFTEVQDTKTAESHSAGDIRLSNTMNPGEGGAFGVGPSTGYLGGDVWFTQVYNPQAAAYQNPGFSGYGYQTFVHELGHAIGLDHPFDPANPVPALTAEDQLKYTTMTYRDFAGDNANGYNSAFYPTTPMLNDILAIQWLYGANWDYNNGNDFYFFSPTASVYQTIWDGGGVDTLSAFNQTQGCVINLNSGQWSEIGVAFDNGQSSVRDCLTIAYGAVIENATGSAFNDRLVGNGVANILEGGRGDDTYVNVAPGDTIIEIAGQGNDAIEAGFSIDLNDYEGLSIESAILSGVGNFSITGTSGNNKLQGNAGQNVLSGLAGDDIYVIADLGGWNDILLENANEGTDTVNSVLAYTLPDNIENLTLSGPASSGTGNALDNILQFSYTGGQLYGLGGNDILIGGSYADMLVGGTGDDLYRLESGWNDTVVELAGEGYDTVEVDASYSLVGTNIEAVTLLGYSEYRLTGNDSDNTLRGNNSQNILDSGAGVDILIGGGGDDIYVADNSDFVLEDAAGGVDTLRSASSIVLHANVEKLQLTGAANLSGTGNELDNTVWGNSGDNVLKGEAGADLLLGDVDISRHAGVYSGALTLGAAGVQTLFTGPYQASEALALGSGQIVVNGRTFTGNDQVFVSRRGVISFGGAVIEQTGYGIHQNTDLSSGAEPAMMLAPLWSDWGVNYGIGEAVLVEFSDDTGDGINDHLKVQWDVDYYAPNGGSRGASAHFQVEITGGQVIYQYFDLGVSVFEGGHHGSEATIGLKYDDQITLLESYKHTVDENHYIVWGSGAGNDILDGGSGADTLQGGSGNDQYVVDDFGDVVIEGAGKGTDSVRSTVDFTLAANIENLTLQGPLDIDGTGNDLANTLTGNSGDNILSGGAGKDSLSGDGNTLAPEANTLLGGMELLAGDAGVSAILGNDDDTSVALDLGAAVITVAGQNFTGDNQLYISSNGLLSFSAAYTESFNTNLQAGTEPAFLLAALWDDWVTNRDAQDQVLVKLSDDNGDGTQDHLQVQWDVHHYSAGNNLVSFQVEIANGQVKYHYFNLDTGDAGTANGVSATLGLKVPGATELLSHNALVSGWGTLRWAAGAGDDALDGGAGNDTMSGGGGNDRYQVDSRYDKTLELANGGEDEVFSTVSLTLANEIEHLTLQGTALGGTGNALANRLTGNASGNTLKGNAGEDVLDGGGGADVLQGGSEADLLLGGAGNDRLEGGDGADILTGGAGNDGLLGGSGDDEYRLGRGSAVDTLTDIDATSGNLDVLLFDDASVKHDQLWFRQVGSDLEVRITGTSDRVSVKGWYTSADNRVEEIRTQDGDVLRADDVQALVTAMAAFSPPKLGNTTLNSTLHAALDGVIAASWS